MSILKLITESEKKTLLKVLDHRVSEQLNGFSKKFEEDLLQKTNTSSLSELLSRLHQELIHTETPHDPTDVSINYWLNDPRMKRIQLISDVAVRILDNHTKQYLYLNEANEGISGIPNHIFKEKGLKYSNSRTHPWDLLQLIFISKKVLKEFAKLSYEEKLNSRFSFDLRYKHPEKGYMRVHQNVLPVSIDEDGKPGVVVILSTDISEIKKSNRINYYLGVWKGSKFTKVIKGETDAYGNTLSKREMEVLQYAGEGHTSNEIAEKIHLSPETVKTHYKNIIQKVGARNMTEVVRIAVMEGWV